ncbi:hypothetical protein GCM10023091_23940 [Ravibacter arvi]|uniref:DUF4271 domain-containing protein n=1 Tax=Ravibacter arvi TaxID=2051041 RepID=A0ABP8M0P2_9BACT
MVGRRVLLACLFFWGLVFGQNPVLAQGSAVPDGYQLVRNCQDEWLVFNAEYKNYVPYIKSIHETEPSVSLLVDLVQDRHFTFLLKSRKEAFLFVNGALQRQVQPEQWQALSCDSLYRKYRTPRVLLTVFGLRGIEGLSAVMAFPGNAVAADSVQTMKTSLVSLKPRSANVFRDFSIIAWLLILLTAAVVFLSVPTLAYSLMSPLVFLSRDFRAELYNHHRAYSPVIVVSVVILSMITAFLLWLAEYHVRPLLPAFLGGADRDSVGAVVFGFLKTALLCFVLYYFKYFVISVTLRILNMTEVAHIHFIKALQSSLVFYGLLSLGLLGAVLHAPASLEGAAVNLLWAVSVFYGIRLLLLYILLNQPGRIINLYLISYLCVVELIPLIIGIKYIV